MVRSERRTLENAIRRMGFVHVAGVDEVGRGCLAGRWSPRPSSWIPTVTCPDCGFEAVPAAERERLYDRISRRGRWAVAAADPREIDRLNIHQASLRAMQRAVLALAPLPDFVLVDAFRIPGLPMAQRGVVHGDRRCTAIAAASIVAKVTRDRQMRICTRRDPRYGFDRHKGTPPPIISRRLRASATPTSHRRSFRPADAV